MAISAIGRQSLAAHKKLQGKISVTPKAALRTRQDLNLYYTPGVAAVSSYVAEHPEKAGLYTMKANTVAVISDGSAVLGLGNIGPLGALPVMEGKAMIFKTMAGIDAFPIVLDTQDVEKIIETVINIAPGLGGINLEDIAAPRCFEIEWRLRERLSIPVFHDDQHGTAMVVLAGLINALKVTRKNLLAARIVISGVGAAGQAIAELLLKAGAVNIILVDSRGVVSRERLDLDEHKKRLLKLTNPSHLSGGLSDALIGADVFIGVSKAGLLDAAQVRSMAPGAIIFGLANPIPEIMPDVAKRAGAAVVATGRSDFPNQLNNSLGFPGIFRGALDNGVREITDGMLIKAARNLAGLIARPTATKIIPDMFDKRVVPAVAKAIR